MSAFDEQRHMMRYADAKALMPDAAAWRQLIVFAMLPLLLRDDAAAA